MLLPLWLRWIRPMACSARAAPPSPAEDPEYQAAMAQALAARHQAEQILRTYEKRKPPSPA